MNMPTQTAGGLGILSLDTKFSRIVGDVGKSESYPFPAFIELVEGADSTKIVKNGLPEEPLLRRFEAAAQALEKRRARAIVSTCGFLITAQDRIAASVQVPIMLSALSLFPMVRVSTRGRVGILTASKSALGDVAFAAAGVTPDAVEVQGLDAEAVFTATFLARKDVQIKTVNRAEMEQAVVSAARALVERPRTLGQLFSSAGTCHPMRRQFAGPRVGQPITYWMLQLG